MDTTNTQDLPAVVPASPVPPVPPEILEQVLIGGDLSGLTEAQRLAYYRAVCQSLGLNPLSKPFEYLWLNGKLRLYALRDCADQLRRLHGISISITSRERLGDLYLVTARAKDRTGREDESLGAVALGTLKGDALANALMKCETKAKRRVTLSLAGLGWLDETELETIPSAAAEHVRPSERVTPHPLPEGERSSSGPAEQHPTADEISRLVEVARAANVSLEDFGHDMRRLMKLPDDRKVTKKFLREGMTLAQYNTAWAHYGEALRQVLEEDVPDHGTPATAAPVSADDPPSTLDASSSAPDDDTDAVAARDTLRQEALGWGIAEREIDHIVTHHPLDKARTLLWKARRPQKERLAAVAG